MIHSSGRRFFVVMAIFLPHALGEAWSPQVAKPGVVVEEVSKGSAGEKATIQVGDILFSWERPANPPANPDTAEGKIQSVFDWIWVEMEQAPRGRVKVKGERDGKEINFEVSAGNWGIRVRPRFGEEALKIYTDGKAAVSSEDLERGMALWGTLAKSAEAAKDMDLACWMNLRIGDTWAEARRWKEALGAYDSARGMTETTMNAVAHAVIWDSIGQAFEGQDKFEEAEKAYQSARAIRERASGESLSVARSLHNLGVVARNRRDLATAEAYHKRALAIQEKLAPDSLDVAASLNNLGNVAWDGRELATAEAYYKRALAIRQKLAPNSLDVAASLNNLGIVAWYRGELATAEAHYKRALAIYEKLVPDSLDVARPLNNLGMVAWNRGDLAMAEAYYKRALATQEKLAPDSLDVAASLNNLGLVAWNRSELATAETYHKHALTIKEKLAPDSLTVAASLNSLGNVVWSRGDLATSEAYHKRALVIRERLAPDSLTVAASLNNLGEVARDRGELATAEAYYKRALAIQEKLAPDSLDLAAFLNNLGNAASDRGDLAGAEAYHKRALAIRERLAPGSIAEAESQHGLAVVHRKANDARSAADRFLRGIEALEAQFGKLGGNQEAQAGFGAQFLNYYRDYIDLLIELNQPTDAFHILERSRARTLLAMLAERDLVFTADLPDETERERRRIAWEYDRTQARLVSLNPVKDQAQVEQAVARLSELRDSQSQIVAQIRQKSPRLASLQYPEPLDVKRVQSALDPGMVLLSYSIGKEKSYLFALRADASIQVYPLAFAESQLREEVEKFRSLIQRAQLGARDLTSLVDRAKQLYEILLQPASKTIESSERLLIIPDGPLHILPFAALVRGVDAKASPPANQAAVRGPKRDWQYLVEWKPLHAVVSATVYAELRKERQNRPEKGTGKTLIALGDPKYPAFAARENEKELDRHDAVVRSILTRGYRLAPLPATKGEVAAIGELYKEKADTYVGDAATEERAKGVSKDTKYLHFACHGLLDEHFPLNSGLALTIPEEMKEGQDNGILQAWEIFERVRIDADLIVLSACETALGKEMGGEGLVGLTRAFQYAGARSVMASLWSVADESTAELMKRFYGYLKSGKSKDAALRQVQLDLIRNSISVQRGEKGEATRFDASHPYYWAAFQINGDWR